VRAQLDGALVDDWIAPPLTAANPAPAPWTQDELYDYLRNGVSVLHGTSAGPMAAVVHAGLSALPDADIQTIALYFADIDRADDREAAIDAAISRAMSYAPLEAGQVFDDDARLYTAACASCHYNAGKAPLAERPDLALNSALSLADPSNLVQVMLRGISASDGMPGVVMPGFVRALTDADIVRIAAYLRRTRTSLSPWTNLDAKVAALRQQIGLSH